MMSRVFHNMIFFHSKRVRKQVLIPLLLITILFPACKHDNYDVIQSLTATSFSKKLEESADAIIIDVRTREEFDKGHLLGAINLDWNGHDFKKNITQLEKTNPVFLYCLSDARSSAAAKMLARQGFAEIYELRGGILKWRAAGLPENRDDRQPRSGMTIARFENLKQKEQTLLVNFYADWCAPCKKMKPYLEEIASEMKDEVEIIRINADDNQELMKVLKIDTLPVLQLFQQGEMTWSHEGFIAKKDVISQLQ